MSNSIQPKLNSSTTLQTCLIVVLRESPGDTEVLLGEKLRGFGAGRVVAPGGKIDPGESPRVAAARELFEETSLQIAADALHDAGLVTFWFDTGESLAAHIFTTSEPAGRPQHSDEIAVTWTPVSAIPYERMWPDAEHWLSKVLDGQTINMTFFYGPDGRTLRQIENHTA